MKYDQQFCLLVDLAIDFQSFPWFQNLDLKAKQVGGIVHPQKIQI